MSVLSPVLAVPVDYRSGDSSPFGKRVYLWIVSVFGCLLVAFCLDVTQQLTVFVTLSVPLFERVVCVCPVVGHLTPPPLSLFISPNGFDRTALEIDVMDPRGFGVPATVLSGGYDFDVVETVVPFNPCSVMNLSIISKTHLPSKIAEELLWLRRIRKISQREAKLLFDEYVQTPTSQR